MPLNQFTAQAAYDWDAILATLAAFGYPNRKVGALEVAGDLQRNVFVFPSEVNSENYTNAIAPTQQQFVMEVNPLEAQLNQRLAASATGLQVGAFYRRRNQSAFKYLGPARYVSAQGLFFTFAY